MQFWKVAGAVVGAVILAGALNLLFAAAPEWLDVLFGGQPRR